MKISNSYKVFLINHIYNWNIIISRIKHLFKHINPRKDLTKKDNLLSKYYNWTIDIQQEIITRKLGVTKEHKPDNTSDNLTIYDSTLGPTLRTYIPGKIKLYI